MAVNVGDRVYATIGGQTVLGTVASITPDGTQADVQSTRGEAVVAVSSLTDENSSPAAGTVTS